MAKHRLASWSTEKLITMKFIILFFVYLSFLHSQDTELVTVEPVNSRPGKIVFKSTGGVPLATSGNDIMLYNKNKKLYCKDANDNNCFSSSENIISVLDYGAIGNGTTNDTTSIQNAITALAEAGGTIYFPNGTYLTSGITVSSKTNIVCQDPTNTIILYSGSSTAIVQATLGFDKKLSINNCGITKQSSQAGTAISMQGVWSSIIQNNIITNFNIGIDLNGTSYGTYFNRIVGNTILNTATGIRLTGGSSQAANANTISDNRITGAITGIKGVAGSGIVQGNLILRNDIEEFATGTSYGIDYQGDNSLLSENWVETTCSSTCTGIYLRGSGNNLLANKYSLVGSGFTQLDYDNTSANYIMEISTGSTPIYYIGDVTGSAQLHLKSSGSTAVKLTNTSNTSSNRNWSFILSSDKICLNQLADNGTTVLNAPACWTLAGLLEQNRSVTIGGVGTEALLFARSANATRELRFGCQNAGSYCVIGTTGSTDVGIESNSQEVLRLTTTGNVKITGNSNTGVLELGIITFANLGSNSNGSIIYCSDCNKTTPCTFGGTGALAKRLNGTWDCN